MAESLGYPLLNLEVAKFIGQSQLAQLDYPEPSIMLLHNEYVMFLPSILPPF